jgi:L-cysteine desulfidase
MDKKELMTKILKKEIVKALGCTEVGLIGYTVALCKPENPYEIEEINLTLDKGTFKNAFSVGVPNTNGFGILPAVVGGLLGDAEKKLLIFDGIEYSKELEDYIKDRLKIDVVDRDIYCKVVIKTKNGETKSTVIKGSHLNTKEEDEELKNAFKLLSLSDFLEYIEDIPKEIEDIILETIKTNKELVKSEYLKLGDDELLYIVEKTASACYERMKGTNKPAMAIAGSGNMGIMATMPIIAYHEANNSKDIKKLIKSLTLSALVTTYATYHSSYISSMCGCVNRGGLGAVCGLCHYIHGNDANKITEAVKSFTANLVGIICDGGKIGCALKLASGCFAVYSSLFAEVPSNNGIVGETFEECVENIAKIGNAMKPVDDEIINILKNKK